MVNENAMRYLLVYKIQLSGGSGYAEGNAFVTFDRLTQPGLVNLAAKLIEDFKVEHPKVEVGTLHWLAVVPLQD